LRRRILIVDDSPVILAAARHVLAQAGYDVEARGEVGEVGEPSGFDLILMDVQMPGRYGDEVASGLRRERSVATPIYLFSTLPASELATRARAAAVDGYISKQLGLDHLVSEVHRILGQPMRSG
jgi:CheY-like chemotaxis protein